MRTTFGPAAPRELQGRRFDQSPRKFAVGTLAGGVWAGDAASNAVELSGDALRSPLSHAC
jgi:hypothetical protein